MALPIVKHNVKVIINGRAHTYPFILPFLQAPCYMAKTQNIHRFETTNWKGSNLRML